jgi:hypothetical protein
VLDTEMQNVRVRGGDPVRLTNLELRLLQFLLTNDGRAQTVDKLTAHVWGHRGLGDRQLLKQLVHRLRQKIEKDPAAPIHLQTLTASAISSGGRDAHELIAHIPPPQSQRVHSTCARVFLRHDLERPQHVVLLVFEDGQWYTHLP